MKYQWNPANLIINESGRIYHLDLNGDEIGNIIFLVGDPERVEHVSKYFDKIEVKRSKREFLTHTGMLGKHRVSVLSTGISTANIDIAINELDAIANINLHSREPLDVFRQLTFIRLGTSGSINPSIEVDTILASRWAVGFDGLLLMYQQSESLSDDFFRLDKALKNWFHLKGLSFPIYLSQASEELINLFSKKYLTGMTATMHGFYAPQSRELRLKGRYPDFIKILNEFEHQDITFSNMEMESSAIYGLSSLLGHRALSFNAIIANRTTGRFSESPYQTVEKMISEVLEDVRNLDL